MFSDRMSYEKSRLGNCCGDALPANPSTKTKSRNAPPRFSLARDTPNNLK